MVITVIIIIIVIIITKERATKGLHFLLSYISFDSISFFFFLHIF